MLSCACFRATSLHSSWTLCNPTDYSPGGSYIHGILQARILEWVAMLSYRACLKIIPTQGQNLSLLCLLHWQAFTTCHLGSPNAIVCYINYCNEAASSLKNSYYTFPFKILF